MNRVVIWATSLSPALQEIVSQFEHREGARVGVERADGHVGIAPVGERDKFDLGACAACRHHELAVRHDVEELPVHERLLEWPAGPNGAGAVGHEKRSGAGKMDHRQERIEILGDRPAGGCARRHASPEGLSIVRARRPAPAGQSPGCARRHDRFG